MTKRGEAYRDILMKAAGLPSPARVFSALRRVPKGLSRYRDLLTGRNLKSLSGKADSLWDDYRYYRRALEGDYSVLNKLKLDSLRSLRPRPDLESEIEQLTKIIKNRGRVAESTLSSHGDAVRALAKEQASVDKARNATGGAIAAVGGVGALTGIPRLLNAITSPITAPLSGNKEQSA